MRRIGYICSISIGFAALGACSATEPLPPAVHVRFVLAAPLCSSIIPVAFLVDGIVVGINTFRVNVPNAHTASEAFLVPAGRHVLGAHTAGLFSYVWRDTTVTPTPGAVAVDTLPFYCS